MKTQWLWPGLVILVIAAAVTGAFFRRGTTSAPTPVKTPLGEVLEMTLVRVVDSPGETRVSRPAEIAAFFSGFSLTPAEPCACAHVESVTIRTTAGEIELSICDHCLDVSGATPLAGHYEMPKEFYRQFQKHME